MLMQNFQVEGNKFLEWISHLLAEPCYRKKLNYGAEQEQVALFEENLELFHLGNFSLLCICWWSLPPPCLGHRGDFFIIYNIHWCEFTCSSICFSSSSGVWPPPLSISGSVAAFSCCANNWPITMWVGGFLGQGISSHWLYFIWVEFYKLLQHLWAQHVNIVDMIRNWCVECWQASGIKLLVLLNIT